MSSTTRGYGLSIISALKPRLKWHKFGVVIQFIAATATLVTSLLESRCLDLHEAIRKFKSQSKELGAVESDDCLQFRENLHFSVIGIIGWQIR